MKICNLRKTVGAFTLSVDEMYIEPNKIHGIIGHNGSGKTVLLKCIMGILTPETGEIDYGDLDLKDVTLMSQRPYLLHGTVYDNLAYPLKLRGIKPDRKEMDALLRRVGMESQGDQYARSLSSGERQKLSFLRAVIYHPRFIMMDETLSNMDPDSEKVMIDLIREIQKTSPVTWLIVSHQLEQKAGLCDVIHLMEKGTYRGIVEG